MGASVDDVIQRVRLEQYRDNVEEALRILVEADAEWPDARYRTLAARIRSALGHLESRDAYAAAYESFYWARKGRLTIKHLERDLRIALGFKTAKTVKRLAAYPEVQLLEREVRAANVARVLDAGCGEGRVALTIAARNPTVRVHGIEVSRTNFRLAQRMNRFPNAAFHQGFLEDAPKRFGRETFDLAYAFAVLEHVVDVDVAVGAIMDVLEPGGRFCFVVPMNEFVAVGPLPEPTYDEGVAGHVRVFTEDGLRRQFGHYDGFVMEKLPGELPNKYPDTLAPAEFGAFFVAISKPKR